MNIHGVSALGPERPFPGLRPFGYADHDFFFGRSDQTYALYRMLDRDRFVAVVGSSGSGKSSLVFAGLLPLLDREQREPGGQQWIWRDMSPGDSPLDRLIDLLVSLVAELEPKNAGNPRASRRDRLAYLIRSSSQGLVDALAEIDGLKERSVVIVVDQFEELFRYATSTQQRDRGKELKWREDAVLFVQLLLTASRDPDCGARFMLTMRSDFIGDCARFQGLPEAVSEAQFLVPSLRRDQYDEIISRPVEKAGGTIDPMLVKRLLTDVEEDYDQLPVLQHCLSRLWEIAETSSAVRPHLSLEHYENTGRMARALSRHADAILLHSLDGKILVVSLVFRALSELDKESRVVRRAVSFSQLAEETGAESGALREVIDRLRADDNSFLRPSPIKTPDLKADTLIDVGHEALLRRWEKLSGVEGASGEPNDPRPMGWLREEEADGRRYQALLSLARDRGAAPTILPPEQSAWWETRQPTRRWAERYGGGYDRVTRLIDNSRDMSTAQTRRLELERKSRRRMRGFIVAIPALLVLVVISAVAGYYVLTQKMISDQNAATALNIVSLSFDPVLEGLNSGTIPVSAAKKMLGAVHKNVLEISTRTTLTPALDNLLIRVLVGYSDVNVMLGDNKEALDNLTKAKIIIERHGENAEWRRLLYTILFRIGDLANAREQTTANREEALLLYRKAQAIAQDLLHEDPKSPARQFDRAFVDNKVGEILQAQRKFSAAGKQFESALQIAREMAINSPASIERQAVVPSTLTKIGTLLAEQGTPDLDGALARYQEALMLQQELLRRAPGNAIILSNLAKSQGLIGDALLRRNLSGDFSRSKEAFQAGIKINEDLRDADPDSSLWLGFLAAKYARYGTALKDRGDSIGAMVQFRKEVVVRQELTKKDPTRTTWQRNLANSKSRIESLSELLPPAVGPIIPLDSINVRQDQSEAMEFRGR